MKPIKVLFSLKKTIIWSYQSSKNKLSSTKYREIVSIINRVINLNISKHLKARAKVQFVTSALQIYRNPIDRFPQAEIY